MLLTYPFILAFAVDAIEEELTGQIATDDFDFRPCGCGLDCPWCWYPS
jgi:hypothetical protein